MGPPGLGTFAQQRDSGVVSVGAKTETSRVGVKPRKLTERIGVLGNNEGNRPVTFADTRTARRLGPRRKPRLLVADQGCGYSPVEGRIELACLTYLDIPTIKPHRARTRTVTLWKGLRGMGQLEPGTYVFRKKVHFQVGKRPPAEGAGRTATIRIVYQVEAA
jgi:hypothetical protein